MKSRPVFVTLGPSGTNHEMVTRNYLSFRDLHQAHVELIDTFQDGLAMIARGEADFMIQVAVHPDCADTVATGHFEHGIRIIDTFISPSKQLGIVTRMEIDEPKTLAIQPATRKYADLGRWKELIPVSSIMRIGEGLLNGDFDSGLTTLEFAASHSDRLRVDLEVGTVDDPWIVLGRKPLSTGKLVAWPDSPAVEQFEPFRD
jgi:hypothetical protein